jgi:Domain of unknown function (DUF4261)
MSTYGVELLYIHPPSLEKKAVLAALRKRCPSARPLDDNPNEGMLAFVHPDHPVSYSNGSVPAQTVIVPADKKLKRTEDIEAALQQTWSFPEAPEIVAACTRSVLVTDMMSSGLPYRERFDLFSNALLAILDVAPPDAIHWRPSQQIVNPATYVAAASSDAERFLAGGVNVRFFNIQGTGGDMVMDTLGLAALGLPDLQCHFRELEPGEVAGQLFNLAAYIFEKGDVIGDGHTVEGTTPGAKWRCRHEDSLIEPDREVLDIDPGDPYAAGDRDR